MMTLNLAVLGAEGRGRLSQLAHQPENNVHLVAACSLFPEHLADYREKCGPGIFLAGDYRDLLARPEVDAVFICTPDHLHHEHACAALRAGKHVFLEKPLGITVAECDDILRVAEMTGRMLYVGHSMRFFPVMQKMRALIAEGRIGRVEAIWCRHFVSYGGDAYFKDWHSERRNTTGLLLQKGAHDIDIIHWLAGGYTARVAGMGKLSVYNRVADRRAENETPNVAFTRNNWPPLSQKKLSPVIDVEDHNMMLMQLDNGVQASYQQCHYTPDDFRNYTIIGTEGRLENYGDTSTEEKWATIHLWNQRTGYSEMGHEIFRISPAEGGHGGADPAIVADFIRFLRTGERLGATPMDARMATAAGCLATDSIRNGNVPRDVLPFGSENQRGST